MKRLAVFASGRGSNFQAIADHVELGILKNIEASLLLTNDIHAQAIGIAKERAIPHVAIEGVYGKKFQSKQQKERARKEFDERALEALLQHKIDFVALAGFMQVLGSTIIAAYNYRIMNIHPALDLVRFGGHGMFGDRVHAAVLQAGEKESGCTVHYVDESVDGGPIIVQSAIHVEPSDTPESLAARILIREHQTYPKALQLHEDGRVSVRNGQAVVDLGGGWEERWNIRQEAYAERQVDRNLMEERLPESQV